MNRVYAILLAVSLTASVLAQSPEIMSYQAVIRDLSNNLVTNHAIGLKISILQGSISGSSVYSEIFNPNPTTNANGLVTVEIGGGIPIFGTFSTINWSDGLYYIKTETDPTGETNYTITGISQILSVPYALHAKTAESITGTISETDPVYTASQASNIKATDISNLDNLSGINTGDQDLSALATTTSVTTGLATKVDKETGKGLSTNDYSNDEKTKLGAITGTNTGDQDLSAYAITASVTTGLATKVDKETGKGLSTNDYSNDEKTKLGAITGTNTGDQDLSALATTTSVTTDLATKVDKVTGKALSTEDYTTVEKTKLAGLQNADGSETKVTAGTNVTVTGTGTTGSPYIVNATKPPALAIGQSYQGGIIFWLDETGQHGLVAAPADISTLLPWSNGIKRRTGATNSGINSGAMNTSLIIAAQLSDNPDSTSFAALACANYYVSVNNMMYGGWYLPSKGELYLMYLQKNVLDGFIGRDYWSSTEGDFPTEAYHQYTTSIPLPPAPPLPPLSYVEIDDKSLKLHVRAIKAF
ncbi:MAG: hypothetical protein WC780_06890 [Lentimicrobiaceae bacterium]|jgi:hypothetical protein